LYKRQVGACTLPFCLSVTVEQMAKLLTAMGANGRSKLCGAFSPSAWALGDDELFY
jgi:hypothetical protein